MFSLYFPTTLGIAPILFLWLAPENKKTKIEAKPEEKRKPGTLDVAIRAVNQATERYEKEEGEAKSVAETFNKKKLETIQKILKDLVDIERAYHEKILEMIGSVKEKAEAIKVEEEAIIAKDSELSEE